MESGRKGSKSRNFHLKVGKTKERRKKLVRLSTKYHCTCSCVQFFIPFEQCLVCASEPDDIEIAADGQTLEEQQERLFRMVDLSTTHTSRPGNTKVEKFVQNR